MQQMLLKLWYFLALTALGAGAYAQCPTTLPIQGAPLRGTAPLFPATNWWNLDISGAPVDPGSSSFIAFINNGGTRRLHPDFGGEEAPGSVNIYGLPYAVVDGNVTPRQPVTFDYWDESDGVDLSSGQGVPFYPIPAQAITQPHWIEGGAAGNVDQRSQSDRHLLIVDCANNHLYELYNVWYSTAQARWYAGSGAFFDMNTNNRRPEGWTSADAAGLAVLPGLVRYDEAYNAAVTDIGHAFRVTVRATNGYVYPASHRAGSTAGALPLGARLRLKANVKGSDPALRTTDPNLQKIFRAMQKYGLIVADNGSDLYVTGTFDTRWNNSLLNPAFALLSASDFEVVQLGWNPPPPSSAALSGIAANPSSVTGGTASTGSVTLTAGAPSGGAVVALSSNIAAATVPPSVTVAQGATAATFPIATSAVTAQTVGTLTASYGGVSKASTFTVNAPPPSQAAALSSLTISPTTVVGGASATGTVQLAAGAPSGGATVSLSSSNPNAATVPSSVTVSGGATTATFTITTQHRKNANVTITASYGGVTKSATLQVKRR